MNCINTIEYGVCEDTHLHTLQNLSKSEVAYFRSFLPLIPKPPLNDSFHTQQEIFYLYRLQHSERHKMRETIKVIDMDLTEPFLNLCSMLKVDPLHSELDKCISHGQKASLFFKAHFNRARPFQLSLFYTSRFAPMGSISAWTASYPSGHTIQAEMICRMYSRVYPEHTQRFMQVAKLISYSRLVGGFHFQSDIEVGKHIVKLIDGE